MIYKEYFELTEQNKQKYGHSALVLMQVGSFYEMYGLKKQSATDKSTTDKSTTDKSNTSCNILTEVSSIVAATNECMLKIAEKKEKYDYRGQQYTIVMAGFGECSLDKYLPILVEAGFSCVVYVQEDDMAKRGSKKRVFHGVFSAGTFFPAQLEATQIANKTNNIMTLWIHRYRGLLSSQSQTQEKYMCAYSVTSVHTGKSYLYEYTTPVLRTLSPTSFDELERAVSSFQPNEVIFVHQEPKGDEAAAILQYIGINASTQLLHYYAEADTIIQKCMKPAFTNAILTEHFGEDCRNVIEEFDRYEWATQSFCLLLDFVKQHSAHLVDRISPPLFSNTSNRLILGNHTLRQLNILPQHQEHKQQQQQQQTDNTFKSCNRLSSVASCLNYTVTPMGKRGFYQQILNPVFDTEWLNSEYEAIATVIEAGNEKIAEVRGQMTGIRDLDRILRQIAFGNAEPISLWYLYDAFQKMGNLFANYPVLLKSQENNSTCNDIRKVNEELDRLIDWTVLNSDIENNNASFIRKCISPSLDKLQEECNAICEILEAFRKKVNEIIGDEFVKWHETAKTGKTLQITATRGKNLQTKLKSMKESPPIVLKASNEKTIQITFDEIHIVSAAGSAGTSIIQCSQINTLLQSLQVLEIRFSQKLQEVYRVNVLQNIMHDWYDLLQSIVRKIECADILQSKAYAAATFGYCQPRIVEKSCIRATKLRHPLIEQLQKNELYVPNEALFDENKRGLLLYGTNAVGKTSYIKSVGVAVIMAQAGMYVAAEEFEYMPYEAIYSRILGNDDLFKGLSTFVVEMSELRTILREATTRTLVIGDEVCSGTETESALSIFTAALLHLYRAGSHFLFATHFHEVAKYAEIAVEMADALMVKHMSVIFDAAADCLIYDRKLRDGAGPAIYGLEVAKSLYMPVEFLEEAFRIRQKYFPETRSILSMEKTRYNADVIRRPLCQKCNREVGEEVHHLQPQEWAAKDTGLIGGIFHKNHAANLVTVCQSCHDEFHKATEKVVRKTKTSKGYKIV
jgi:DNA mismatch repair protein MutS